MDKLKEVIAIKHGQFKDTSNLKYPANLHYMDTCLAIDKETADEILELSYQYGLPIERVYHLVKLHYYHLIFPEKFTWAYRLAMITELGGII